MELRWVEKSGKTVLQRQVEYGCPKSVSGESPRMIWEDVPVVAEKVEEPETLEQKIAYAQVDHWNSVVITRIAKDHIKTAVEKVWKEKPQYGYADDLKDILKAIEWA